MNVYWFFIEERAAALLQFPDGVSLGLLIEAYAATIDTAAWVVLLLMFELETDVLEDQHFTPPVIWTLHGMRILCYAFIIYAFYGYVTNLQFVNAAVALSYPVELCTLADGAWVYAVDLDEYLAITSDNCRALSTSTELLQLPGMQAVVDLAGHADIVGLAWIDVINSAVWLAVVLILEIDVRLQERSLFEGWAFYSSTAAKACLYSALLYAAVYWGVNGDFVDFWDAFLWLLAFVFIELNVFEWRAETKAQTEA